MKIRRRNIIIYSGLVGMTNFYFLLWCEACKLDKNIIKSYIFTDNYTAIYVSLFIKSGLFKMKWINNNKYYFEIYKGTILIGYYENISFKYVKHIIEKYRND